MKRVLTLLALIIMVLPLAAQEPNQPPARERAQTRVATFLQLTEEQAQQWQGLLETRAATLAPVREEIATKTEELVQQLDADSPDPTEVGMLTIAIHGLRNDIRDAHVSYLESFELLLDEEQGTRLDVIRRADRLQPLIPAFKAMGLIPDGQRPPVGS